MKTKYKAAIIGAGNIGAFYSPPNQYNGIITHAHAYHREPRTKLVAFVDTNQKKVQQAAQLWRIKSYSDIHQLFKNEKIDIVSICTPDETHQQVLESCLEYQPQLIFCEKPLTTNIKASQKLVKKYHQAKIPLAVNYTRRWNPALIKLKKQISKKKFGSILNITGYYDKGIMHNGSHLIDLLRYLFGEVTSAIPLSARIDWKKTDPTIDAFLKFKNDYHAHLIGSDSRQFELFEIDMLFSQARLQLINCGNQLTHYKVISSSHHPDYNNLKLASVKDTHLISTMLKVIPSLIDSLENKSEILCSGTDALKTQKICSQLIKKWIN